MRNLLAIIAALCMAAPAFAQRIITHGATSQSVYIRIIDLADGSPETGVTSATGGLDLEYVRNGAAPQDITESDLAATDSAYSSGGMKHVGGGRYRIDVPNAAFTSGVASVDIQGVCTDMIVIPVTVQLAAFDLQTATQAVNVTQFGGSNGTFSSGRPEVNATHLSGDSVAADNAEAFFDGTGYAGTNNVIPAVTTVTTTTNLTNKGDGSGFTAIPWNPSWDAEVQSEADDALVANRLDHLLLQAVTGTDVTDNSLMARLASKNSTADWDTFVNTTDSLEAIRDNSGGGGGGATVAEIWGADPADYAAGTMGGDVMKNTDTIVLDEDAAGDLADAIATSLQAGILSPVDSDVVDDSRTWFATDSKARNIITLGDNFAGTLALQPDLNPGTTILTVDSVSITGAATVTATGLTVNRSKTRAHFTVPTLTTTGTYTVVVTVTTIDGQTIPTTATLRVQ